MIVGAAMLYAVSAATTSYSLWSTSTIPRTISTSDKANTELGLKFKSGVAGYVTGVRFYKSAQNTGVHTGNLWDSSGKLLATVTFSGETASGWQSATFAAPVSIAANVTYVISYHAPSGHYSLNSHYFKSNDHTKKDLIAPHNTAASPNGVFVYSASQSAFPNQSGNGANYWVDVVFNTKLINPQPAPAAPAGLTATAQANNSVVVNWQASVSANTVTGYTIYRDGAKLANIANVVSYTDTTTQAGKSYSYQVQATDNIGQASALSAAATVTVPASSTGGSTTPPSTPPTLSSWPSASNTGYEPTGVTLHSCSTTITSGGTYDSCQFNGDLTVKASDVHITRSLIKGGIDSGSGFAGQQSGLVISDTTIDCGCLSQGASDTPSAIQESNFTLLRVNLYNSGHGAAVKSNVVVQDSYIHGLGGNTDAHKDAIFSGDGNNVTIRHNNIECNDGSKAGCTSAIGLLTDFGDITNYTIDNNLLNTIGSYCFYASGGPQKQYSSNHITFTNNHFGRKYSAKCGGYGPVTYWDASKPGMVWSGNVWDDTGAAVLPEY